jgi:hypothetical protein
MCSAAWQRARQARGYLTGSTEEVGPLRLPDLQIRTKDRRVIPFVPNTVQRAYLDVLLPEWEESPVGLVGRREILLKARQFGFSTLILALLFIDTVTHPHTQTVVIAHDTESTERLFQMVHRFQRLLPAAHQKPTKYSSRRELYWEGIDSYFFVGTAGAGQFGRGGTINNVHGSECAVWPDARDLVSGLLQAVPVDGNVFLETTANGLGNWFSEEYEAAEHGDSAFTPRFHGWQEHEEYQAEPEPGFTVTEKEGTLQQAYGLTLPQLAWRRGKVRELREKFPQEYPANPREAFLTSGNPYFDREYLDQLSALLQGPEHEPVGALRPALLIPCGAHLSIWKPPVEGRRYVIGADTAEGIDEWGDHDFDAADVFDVETWEQVAHLHGRWDTHDYGLLLAALGRWYNTALLCIERNNHGHAVINAAMHAADYPQMRHGEWTGLYLHEEYDEHKKLATRRPGWPTTTKTKFFALDSLASALIDRDLKLHSRQTVGELITFVKLPSGKAGGEGRRHDDRVTSLALTTAMLKLRPGRRENTIHRPQGEARRRYGFA